MAWSGIEVGGGGGRKEQKERLDAVEGGVGGFRHMAMHMGIGGR